MFKNFSAMILAAGFGKRLAPLTNEIPKPLVEINKTNLLKNSINFLFTIGCKKIVINTHYKHELISEFIGKYFKSSNIIISHEKNILDTGGGLKNALHFFDDEKVIVTNCDIFWTDENKNDVINLISNFSHTEDCKLLLVSKKNANGIKNKSGDFYLKKNIISRWKEGDDVIYYSGLQILKTDILKNFNNKKFSFNDVWDFQIKRKSLYGVLMKSKLYHVGDFEGLNNAINSIT